MHTCLTQESPGRQSASTLHLPVHKRQMKKVVKFCSFLLTKCKDAHSTRVRLNFVTIANPAQPPQPMIIVLPWVCKHTLMVMCLDVNLSERKCLSRRKISFHYTGEAKEKLNIKTRTRRLPLPMSLFADENHSSCRRRNKKVFQ